MISLFKFGVVGNSLKLFNQSTKPLWVLRVHTQDSQRFRIVLVLFAGLNTILYQATFTTVPYQVANGRNYSLQVIRLRDGHLRTALLINLSESVLK